jgi:hypothetical protein
MCGDHTKEQLTNWVMSKDAVASCFIKDVLSMSESEHAGGDALASLAVSSSFQLGKRQVFPITFLAVYLAGRFPWLPS